MFQPEELFVVENSAWNMDSSGHTITSMDFSSDGSSVIFSNLPGFINISSCFTFDLKRKSLQQYTNSLITGCKFHPNDQSLILTSSKDGQVMLVNFEKDEANSITRHLGSNILTMNCDSFGDLFAIGCADGSIRVYNFETYNRTKVLVKNIQRTSSTSQVNIYSIMFHPEDSNILLAAGWNDRVLFWDLRTGNAEKQIAGPHIRGPGLDFYNDMIITASSRDKKQIEIWDYNTTKKIRDIPFELDSSKKECFATSVKVSRNGLDLISGGSGTNFAQAFEFTTGTFIGQTQIFSSPISVISTSPFGSGFVVGTEQGEVASYMIRVKNN